MTDGIPLKFTKHPKAKLFSKWWWIGIKLRLFGGKISQEALETVLPFSMEQLHNAHKTTQMKFKAKGERL